MGSGSRLFGSSGHRPGSAHRCGVRAGVTALLGLVAPWLFDSPDRSDLVGQVC